MDLTWSRERQTGGKQQLQLERCGYVKIPGGEQLTSETFGYEYLQHKSSKEAPHGYLLASLEPSLAGRTNQPQLEGVCRISSSYKGFELRFVALQFRVNMNSEWTPLDFTPPEMFILVVKAF